VKMPLQTSASKMILGVVVLCVAGYFASRAYHIEKGGLAQKEMAQVPDLFRLARSSKVVDRKRAIQLQQDYDAIFAKVLARHPELVPDWKSIPDEENGFLQWLNFCDQLRSENSSVHPALPLTDEINKMIRGVDDWNGKVMASYLTENSEMLEEITRIGLMPEQSTHQISVDRWSFMSANVAKQSAELLFAASRLAAESGDGDRSLKYVQAAIGLGRHHIQVETPTLTGATISILVHLTALDTTMKHVLPALELDQQDLEIWHNTLKPTFDQSYASTIRGEFWASIRGMVIPAIANNSGLFKGEPVKDTDALYDVMAEAYIQAADRAERSSQAELWLQQDKSPWLPKIQETLSPAAQNVYECMLIGLDIYGKGWARAEARDRQYAAAFAIMEGQDPPVDLIMEKPFVYDEVTRTLSMPDDPALEGLEIKPIKLP